MIFFPRFLFAALAILLQTVSAFDVNCKFNTNEHWVVSYGDPYFCVISDIRVETSDKLIRNFSGDHQSGKSDSDVNTFRINQSPDCHYFPKGLESFFGQLKGIMLTNTGLKTISRYDLKPFPDLLDLWIYTSKLKIIGPNLLTFNTKLKFLDFGNNRIYSVSPDLFDPLRNLNEVKFNQNICIHKDGKGAAGIAAVKQEILERCQNGLPDESSCRTENQHLLDKIVLLEANAALLKQEVARLKSEINSFTTF